MTWAGRRRFIIAATVAAVLIVVAAVVLTASVYRAPSCSDGRQNQQEAGIDCGSPCAYLCKAQVEQPVVRFTKALEQSPGRTDIIAYVDNPNQDAYARGVGYNVVLYGTDHVVVARTNGIFDLPPGATVPVFIPGITSGVRSVASAFLTLDDTTLHWQSGRDTRALPRVADSGVTGTTASPRVVATLTNSSALPLASVKVVATLFDAAGSVINASQTLIPSIPAQGSAEATFTWPVAFTESPTRIEILPVIPLVSP